MEVTMVYVLVTQFILLFQVMVKASHLGRLLRLLLMTLALLGHFTSTALVDNLSGTETKKFVLVRS